MADATITYRTTSGSSHGSRAPSRRVVFTPPNKAASPGPGHPGQTPSEEPIKNIEKQWQTYHDDKLMNKLVDKRIEKKETSQLSKQKARHLARKIPVEILAKEWLSDNKATVETRAFMVDKILPTLILGIEKLLIEADGRGLMVANEIDKNFNPINYLAQYLMRNNPRFSNFSEASPYIRGLREVHEELKKQLFDYEENRLARIKAEAKAKREQREEDTRMKKLERTRREECLKKQFLEWNVGYDGRIELTLLQNALRSFVEVTEQFPEELRLASQLSEELEATDETGRTMNLKEFAKYLQRFIEHMPSEVFDQFLDHMSRCALTFRAAAQREHRRVSLTNLFVSCDHSGIGLLDRHRILSLFETFYDQAKADHRSQLTNPRAWPVVEVDEAIVSDLSDDEEETEMKPSTEKTSDTDVTTSAYDQTTSQDSMPASEQVSNSDEKLFKTESDLGTEKQEDTEKPDSGTEMDKGEGEKRDDGSEKGDDAGEKEETVAEKGMEEMNKSGTDVLQDSEENVREADKSGFLDSEKSDRVEDVPLPKTPKVDMDSMQPPPTRGASVSFEEGTVFEKDRLSFSCDVGFPKLLNEELMLFSRLKSLSLQISRHGNTCCDHCDWHIATRGSGSQSQMSAFDENTVNVSQFVQVTENFLGELPPQDIFQSLVKFLRDGYVETEDEKMQRLLRAHREAQSAKRKYRVDHLFEKWDNDGSGYLDLDEIETIMSKYKDGQEKAIIQKARSSIKKKNPAHDSRLSKREFREFVQFVIEEIPGADTFEYFLEYLESSVERTYAERIRGEARKKWLQLIVKAAETGGASMEPIYRSVFQALYKDAETHGGAKVISASIAMLESNDLYSERGDTMLRYVSTTSDDAPYMLGKSLYRDMKGISFAAVDQGKPIHVPRVNNHGNIMFWRPDRNLEAKKNRHKKESDGSFIVVPLKDRLKRVFGTLGVDTLNDPHTKAIFITHEIQFFQGIAKAFSIAYHHVDQRRKTMTITESAVSWIHRRSPHVLEISVYMVEPDGKDEDYVLRKMMTTDHKGEPQPHPNPARLERKDNLFRDYLFKCVDNSEAVTADAYGQRHLAFPLRDSSGMAVAVVDLSTGETKTLPKYERKEILHMLKLLQTAQKELTRESASGEKTAVLEAEMQHEDSRAEIMFDRLMLMDLKENVNKLDTRAYAELKSYKDPPKFVQNILKATLSLFYLDEAMLGHFDDWNNSKMYLNTDLNQKIAAYDPTKDGASMPFETLSKPLDDVPHGAVAKHSSVPAEYLYNWVFACLSLIQHTQRMKKNKTK